ncbi:TPA: hypothetical protein ACIGX0_004904, partial [Escherichia coli]
SGDKRLFFIKKNTDIRQFAQQFAFPSTMFIKLSIKYACEIGRYLISSFLRKSTFPLPSLQGAR